MSILITGATGFIGNKLALQLADEGDLIHVLARNQSSSLQHPNIKIFKGDLSDKVSINQAMKGCKKVYHCAAFAKAWTKDIQEIFKTNVDGSVNIMEAALQSGVEKIVVTSSCGVTGAALDSPTNEDSDRKVPYRSNYELSKKMQEDAIASFVKKGLDVVIVRPSKVYGPGVISSNMSLNATISRFIQKGVAFIPFPYKLKANFSFIDDVVLGHRLAMEKGKCGEKYIIGGHNISFYDFFKIVRKFQDNQGWLIPVGKNFVLLLGNIQNYIYKLGGKEPAFSNTNIDSLYCNYLFSSNKAIQELGYKITPLEEALRLTFNYFKLHPYK